MKNTKQVLSNKFNTDMKDHCFHYEKIDTPHIVIYKWENGIAYKAPYKCLHKQMDNLMMIDTFIKNKFKIKNKRGEYYLFANEMHDYVVDDLEIRELTLQDEFLLERMMDACRPEESSLAQITIHDIHVLGGFIKGELVGLSSILDLWGAYDIGIITHPNFRKRGVSSALVAGNAKWVLAQNKICMYRCDEDNLGSYKTALKLSFEKTVDVIIYELEKEV